MVGVITSGAPDEKVDVKPTENDSGQESANELELESHEVFKKTEDGVDFRNVSWQFAAVIFLKTIFATGVLSRYVLPTSAITDRD